jgi:hypothetical protein
MKTKQVIGFANKYYTLWTIREEEKYITDSYGKHWLVGTNTHYIYEKNISFDLDKVKYQYPDLSILEDLRGKTQSWVKESTEDLCPNIMKFGKYIYQDIDNIVISDFQYIIWMVSNKSYTSNGIYAANLPIVKQHFKDIEDSLSKKDSESNTIFEDFLKNGSFDFVAEKNLSIDIDNDCPFAFIHLLINELTIKVKFKVGTYSENYYNGYKYGLPIINGKPKRIKGKNVSIQFEKDNYLYEYKYTVIVNSISIN